jgi:exopolyphosphatase / guanosine-5'-triphosphate,3'-diphosphate pyrophosphatase
LGILLALVFTQKISMQDTIAIIDLGTNTFHLLIAEVHDKKTHIIHREKVGVKLGLEGISKDVIQPEALARAIKTLEDFKIKIDQSKVSSVYAFGTSALRNAGNTKIVTTEILEATGIEIKVISGDEEAELIYKGVKAALNLGEGISLIMDIGAGSVEFILANQSQTLWKKSIEIGAQRILEKFQLHDPITSDEISLLNNFFEDSLAEVHQAVQRYQPDTLVGSSGTFDTLSEIYCAVNVIKHHEHEPETPLTLDSFYSIYQQIITKNKAERKAMIGMIELRVDLIVVGCCLVRFILERYGLKQIRVSSYSLKEGALASLSEK